MAAETLANLAPALAQTFAPQIVRLWNRSAIMAKSIRVVPGGGQGAGQNIAWDVEYSGATANSFAEGSDVASSEFNFDPVTKAVLPWGAYRSAFQISSLEIAAAAQNIGNATALEDIVGERFLGSVTKLIQKINVDLFAGTGLDASNNPTIVGLETALASSGSYAGINKGSVTEWAGNLAANGGTARALTLDVLAQSEQLAFVASGKEPDLLFCTPSIHTKYEGLFNNIVRVVEDGRGPIPSYQGSSKNLYWRGNPVVRDRNAVAGSLYMLHSPGLALRYLPFPGTSPDATMLERKALLSSNGDEFEQTPLMAHCTALGKQGSSYRFMVEMFVQLQVNRPNEHVLVHDITE